jgi:putative transposase
MKSIEMRKYRSYHTTLKQLTKRARLPKEYLDEIDRSTLWRWKKEENNKYTGNELSNIEVLDNFICRKEAQKVMRAYLKIAYYFSCILNSTNQLNLLFKKNLSQFVSTVLKFKSKIDIKLVLRLCKVPVSVFYYWKNKVSNSCTTSLIQLCKKRYPEQLTNNEVVIMKGMMTDEKFRFWPLASIAYYALRENIVSVSLATWYLYRKKLGIERQSLPKKIKYSSGIRAIFPDQIWHADITIVKTKNDSKYYVYLLIDNFSRFILSWRIEHSISGMIRVDTIREAYNKLKTRVKNITLITDGGPENDNDFMQRFVINETECFKTVIAQRDIPFSNSLIEAQNKLFKYRYLFRQQYNNEDELRRVFENDVFDFNFQRPHVSLKGFTPYEAHSGMLLSTSDWSEYINQARKDRIIKNRKQICELCR